VLSNFYRMCRDVYDNLYTKLQMPSSNGISLITTDLKVKNIILLATLSFYTHSTKILLQKNLYNFPRSITIHPKMPVTIITK